MRLNQLREQISILKNTKKLILEGKLLVSNQLLTLLEKVGVNLDGYKRTDPIKENRQDSMEKHMIYKNAA